MGKRLIKKLLHLIKVNKKLDDIHLVCYIYLQRGRKGFDGVELGGQVQVGKIQP